MTSLRVVVALALASVPASAQAPDPGTDLPDVTELTISDVQEAYGTGAYSAVDLTRAYLSRIERYEPHYNAFISMDPGALEVAAELDAEYAQRGPRGPLHGIPLVIKDNVDQAGLVTTAGFDGFSRAAGGIDMIPEHDATVVQRLRAAGAIILGKTNLPDFALDGTRTRSSVAGVTLNPYDVDRSPGGSSGGTATAVNASFAVVGVGTETGGSIQNPASAQGLVGVKPTFGLVPTKGVVPIAATYVDVVGPMARNVRDAATLLDAIAGPTEEDPSTFAAVGHIPAEGYAARLETVDIEGKRFGLVGTGWRDDWLPLDPRTEAQYREAIASLEALGAEVVEDPFEGSGFVELYEERPRVRTQRAHDMLVYLQGLGAAAPFHSVEEWESLTGRRFPGSLGEPEEDAARVLPIPPEATEAGDAYQAWRMRLRRLFRAVLVEHELDGLFFPQAGRPGPELVEDPERPEYSPNNWPEIPSNQVNDLGVPVITVPFGYFEDGLPFVVAFVGDMWTEGELLGYAHAFEQTTAGRRPPVLVER